MSEELIITKDDLINWLNRPPSNDDLDLIGFITTRLENFYKLEQENKQLKEELEYEENLNEKTLYKLSKYEDRTKELREKVKEYKYILKMQNEREYYSKFLKDFQKENGTNVLPDFDEVYKRYDNLKDENKQLKELTNKYEEEHKTTFETWLKEINILSKLEEWLKEQDTKYNNPAYHITLDKIQELKEKYK